MHARCIDNCCEHKLIPLTRRVAACARLCRSLCRYDGHGGADASEMASVALHKNLTNLVGGAPNGEDEFSRVLPCQSPCHYDVDLYLCPAAAATPHRIHAYRTPVVATYASVISLWCVCPVASLASTVASNRNTCDQPYNADSQTDCRPHPLGLDHVNMCNTLRYDRSER